MDDARAGKHGEHRRMDQLQLIWNPSSGQMVGHDNPDISFRIFPEMSGVRLRSCRLEKSSTIEVVISWLQIDVSSCLCLQTQNTDERVQRHLFFVDSSTSSCQERHYSIGL